MQADKVYYIEVKPRKELLKFMVFAVGAMIIENRGMFALVPADEQIAAQKLPNLRYSK
jgi:hypothetical protein